jgi:biotin carboxyl carrier protein
VKFAYRYQAMDAETIDVEVEPIPDREACYRVTVRGQVFELSARLLHHVAWLKDASGITLQYVGREYHVCDARQRRPAAPTPAGNLQAPTAGRIIRVLVRPGDQVKAGDVLLILEAMKMEQQIMAPQDGLVVRLLCQEGTQVAAGTELVVLEPVAATPSSQEDSR